jgi:hypothetical protein
MNLECKVILMKTENDDDKTSLSKNLRKRKLEVASNIKSDESEEDNLKSDENKNKSLSKKVKTNEIDTKKAEDEEETEETVKNSVVLKSKANFEKKVDNTVKTLKFTGKIPVDDECVTALGNDYHVYIEDGDAYDCMLNQVILLKRNQSS